MERQHYILIIQWQLDQTKKLMFEPSFHLAVTATNAVFMRYYANARDKNER